MYRALFSFYSILRQYVPSLRQYVPSLHVPSLRQHVPSLRQYAPSLQQHVPSSGGLIRSTGCTEELIGKLRRLRSPFLHHHTTVIQLDIGQCNSRILRYIDLQRSVLRQGDWQ